MNNNYFKNCRGRDIVIAALSEGKKKQDSTDTENDTSNTVVADYNIAENVFEYVEPVVLEDINNDINNDSEKTYIPLNNLYENNTKEEDLITLSNFNETVASSSKFTEVTALNEEHSAYTNIQIVCQDDVSITSEDDDDSVCDRNYIPSDISTPDHTEEDEQPSSSKLINDLDSNTSKIVTTNEESKEVQYKPKKRLRNESQWKRNIRKRTINSGKGYTTKSGRDVPAKNVKEPCDDKKCRFKCSSKININQRQVIFKNFYALACKERQANFIAKCIKQTSPRKYRRQADNVRSLNFTYSFYCEAKCIRVCKQFFKSTLCISNNFIATVIKKTSSEGMLEERMQGKHGKHYKLATDLTEGIRSHINSFPRIESHYCRQDTKREYIEGNLNIATMHRLYVQKCNNEGITFAKYSAYEKIFNTEFNIAFFRPKKDQCSLCTRFKNSSNSEKESLKEKYDRHLEEKVRSREEKKIDIANSKNNVTIVACYDLEAVIPLPCGEVSDFYYKSKINVVNFTVFDIANKQGFCYTWHEGIAKRGANEIGTCVYLYLKGMGETKDIIFYSDNCVGQQKNKFVATMYLYAVENLPINSITHKFLITGHTENEADNMHSLIEKEKKRALRNGPIYLPSEVVMILKLAKKTGKSFEVKEINTEDIIDWKNLCEKRYKNFNKNESGEKIDWNSITSLRFEKNNFNIIQYKTSYSDPEYKRINTIKTIRGRKPLENQTLVKAYIKPPQISFKKKQDLLSLCDSNLIPARYQNFYRELKASSNASAKESD